MDRTTLIIAPTYNEIENISNFLTQVTEQVPNADILVVDDSSPDGTQKVVNEFQSSNPHVHLLLRKSKEGLAAAYIAGMSWGLEKGYQVLVQMDVDFSHPPEVVPRLLEQITAHDLVIGSRYIPGGGVIGWSWLRNFISRGGNIYARLILGMPYRDLTAGFNVWRREALEKVRISTLQSRGYAFQIELKYRAHCTGAKIVEVPFHFPDRKCGTSKMSTDIVNEAALGVLRIRRWKPH